MKEILAIALTASALFCQSTKIEKLGIVTTELSSKLKDFLEIENGVFVKEMLPGAEKTRIFPKSFKGKLYS